VVESKGPKTRAKGRASEHGTKSIANGLVGSFNRTILVGGVSTSRVDSIVKFFKERDNERIFVEFTTLVKDNIFVVDIRGVLGKPSA
jgi:hypothetical protein